MIGAGGVGQFVVQGARIAGAAEILVVDPVEARRAQALALGATRAVRSRRRARSDGELDPEGVDYAFDAVGARGDDEAGAPLDARTAGPPSSSGCRQAARSSSSTRSSSRTARRR